MTVMVQMIGLVKIKLYIIKIDKVVHSFLSYMSFWARQQWKPASKT